MERDAGPSDDHSGSFRRLTFVQRQALKGLVKQARKRPDEPLSPADWESYWRFASQRGTRAFKRVLRGMPSSPRCGYCGAPFAGVGARVVVPSATGRHARTRTSARSASSWRRRGG